MREVVTLPPRSFATALVLGGVTGLVILGIGSRIAMRVIGLLEGQPPGFSLGGTATVVFLGTAWGVLGGFLLWLGRRVFPSSPAARGALFWIVVSLLTLRGLKPVSVQRVVVFGPVVALWGAALYTLWCRRFVARWAGRLPVVPEVTHGR